MQTQHPSSNKASEMQAIVVAKYGASDVLNYVEKTPAPSPNAHQLLIRNRASSVNPIDWKLRNGELRYIVPIKFPAILGFDYCGEIVAQGKDCKKFNVGDVVYGFSDERPGHAYAQYLCVDENTAAAKPSSLNPTQAATVPLAALTAWQGLVSIAKLTKQAKVLICGASGGVGHFAVQIALALEAKVTVTASPNNFPLLKNYGDIECIDYHQYALSKDTNAYDIILDTVGALSAYEALDKLTSKGIYVSTLPYLSLFKAWLKSLLSQKKVRMVMVKPKSKDMLKLNELITKQAISPHIHETFALKEIAAAQELSEKGHAVGKIAIKID
ncbi:MAG: NAD(P)-dependent alcohol dehydrogenase [Pseudomonadota bacterium]